MRGDFDFLTGNLEVGKSWAGIAERAKLWNGGRVENWYNLWTESYLRRNCWTFFSISQLVLILCLDLVVFLFLGRVEMWSGSLFICSVTKEGMLLSCRNCSAEK